MRPRRIIAALAAVAATSGVILTAGAAPASANNAHIFCSSRDSQGDFIVAFNTTQAANRIWVHPGECRYGDWMYVPYHKKAVKGSTVWRQGWHYDGGWAFTKDTFTLMRA
jgi:hypothetical protein